MAPRRDAALAERIGHVFERPALLSEALTHPSAEARGRRRTNQRLEFLGDRVLNLVVADMLIARFADEDEGALARRHAALVRRETLAGIARSLGLGDHLEMSRGEEQGGGRDSDANLADGCEALIGAVYLDGGHDVAARFVRTHWAAPMAAHVGPPRDAKTALQEWAQARALGLPNYAVAQTQGPAHAPHFSIEVRLGNDTARGEGPNKRMAQQAAAAALLARLEGGDHGL